jgi:hypothetical protein
MVSEDNIGALGALNRVFELYPDEPFYGFIGDDEFVNSERWDKMLVQAAGDWNVSHGLDDLHEGKRAQGALCIGGKLARAVGYLALPECWHYHGLDSLWESLAAQKACEKIMVRNVKIEHRHWFKDEMRKDECYEIGEKYKDLDFQHMAHWLRFGMKDTIKRIEEAKAK